MLVRNVESGRLRDHGNRRGREHRLHGSLYPLRYFHQRQTRVPQPCSGSTSQTSLACTRPKTLFCFLVFGAIQFVSGRRPFHLFGTILDAPAQPGSHRRKSHGEVLFSTFFLPCLLALVYIARRIQQPCPSSTVRSQFYEHTISSLSTAVFGHVERKKSVV